MTRRPLALLALSTGRQSDALIQRALSWATESGGDLVAAFIIDSRVPERVAAQLADSGFVGEQPSEEFLRALLAEYQDGAREAIARVEAAARARDVSVESVVTVGDLADACLALIDQRSADRVLLMRQDRSALSRFLFGSAVDDVVRRAPCPVEVLDDGGGETAP